jgi:hypothetical protein
MPATEAVMTMSHQSLPPAPVLLEHDNTINSCVEATETLCTRLEEVSLRWKIDEHEKHTTNPMEFWFDRRKRDLYDHVQSEGLELLDMLYDIQLGKAPCEVGLLKACDLG